MPQHSLTSTPATILHRYLEVARITPCYAQTHAFSVQPAKHEPGLLQLARLELQWLGVCNLEDLVVDLHLTMLLST